jgi:hypothetical protein
MADAQNLLEILHSDPGNRSLCRVARMCTSCLWPQMAVFTRQLPEGTMRFSVSS